MEKSIYKENRYFMKDSVRKTVDFSQTDQGRGIPPPPVEKPYRSDQELVTLSKPGDFTGLYKIDLQSAIENRKSRRNYGNSSVSLKELSFLLWVTQGIRKQVDSGHAMRMVPSAGARHALETYLAVLNVEGIEPGFYRYLPIEHKLALEGMDIDIGAKVAAACFYQNWVADASVVFIWAAMPYRMEWRYGLAAHRVILIDAGHVCQNLYLACEAIGAGTCAIAAYDQELMDRTLGLDGENEFVLYAASVGKLT